MPKKKMIRFILLFIVVIAIFVGYYGYREFNRKSADTTALTAAYSLTTSELLTAFQQNEQAANTKYLGKVLAVSGTIKSFDKDSAGLYTLILGDTSSMAAIRSSLSFKTATDSVDFRIGTSVNLKGVCTGFTADDMGLGSDVILTRCVIIKSPNS